MDDRFIRYINYLSHEQDFIWNLPHQTNNFLSNQLMNIYNGEVAQLDQMIGLLDYVDFNFIYFDGTGAFKSICFIDLTQNINRNLPNLEIITKTADQCQHLAGRFLGRKLPVGLDFIFRLDPSQTDKQNEILQTIKLKNKSHIITSFIIDHEFKNISSNFSPSFFIIRPYKKALKNFENPNATKVTLTELTIDHKAHLTYFLIIFQVIIYILTCSTDSLSWSPSIKALYRWGGLSAPLILNAGEHLRLISAAFLHGGLLHLGFNMYALWHIGRFLEGIIGSSSFYTIYFFSLICSSLLSLSLIPAQTIGIGASGAIYGLFACSFVLSYRYRPRVRNHLFASLLPTLILAIFISLKEDIDFGAHLGGIIGGLTMGFYYLKNWHSKRWPIIGFNIICLILSLSTLSWIIPYDLNSHKNLWPAQLQLAPTEELKKYQTLGEFIQAQKNYPRDPIIKFTLGSNLLERGYYHQAEQIFEEILADKEMLHILKKDFIIEVKKQLELCQKKSQ